MKVLISRRSTVPLHTGSFVHDWIPYCQELGLGCEVVDLLAVDNAIELVQQYDILLWHVDNYNYADMLEARSILYSAAQMGVSTYPSFHDVWHFDDKVAEMYVLQAVGAPIPRSHVFYDMEHLRRSLANKTLDFPIVAKLRTGSGSHNVKLLQDKESLLTYAQQMFAEGFSPAPKALYKASSHLRSAKTWKSFVAKLKRLPEFIRTRRRAGEFPNERGYVYLQEFIPTDGYDIRVVVVNGKLTSFYRPVRSFDFRASGGGTFLYDQSLLTPELIEVAFVVAERLQLQSICYDFVINKDTQEFSIIEMSYASPRGLMEGAGGYFDRQGTWHTEPLNIAKEVLRGLLARRGEKIQE